MGIMKAILKKIEAREYQNRMPLHSVKMLFVESSESEELYTYETTIEKQFCTIDEYELSEGVSEQLFHEKVEYANSLIGKTFEVNLFKFNVKELTDNHYVAFEYMVNFRIKHVEEYHVASFMTKEDYMLRMKYSQTMQIYQCPGYLEGVLPDGSTEDITTNLFFPKPIPEKKHFDIPYDKYPNLNESFIVNEAPISEIHDGHHLANQIKEYNISESDFNTYMDQIADYRSKVRAAKASNESIRKKIFFWEPKEVVDELKLSPNVISMSKDSIILSRLYPRDCEEAKKAYQAECERNLRKTFMHEDVDKKDFKDQFAAFRKTLSEKYKGKQVLKPIG